MNIVTFGVASRQTVSARFIAAAKEEEARSNSITFASAELLFQTLTLRRWHMITRMIGAGPLHVSEIAAQAGCELTTITHDVGKLAHVGILERTGCDIYLFRYDGIHVDFTFSPTA